MTEKERLDFLIKHLGNGNAAEFARKVGIDPAAVSRIRNGTINLSPKYLEDILSAFPQVERQWLETGYGYPGDLSVGLVRQRYAELLLKSDKIIDTLTKEIERQWDVIESLLPSKRNSPLQ